jgi:hypothetical protein
MRADRRLVLICLFIAVTMAIVLFTFNRAPVPVP